MIQRWWQLVLLLVLAQTTALFGVGITSMTPSFAQTNTPVVIKGYGFAINGTTIRFNGALAKATNTTMDGTEIHTSVPWGATTGPVTASAGGDTGYSPTDFVVIGPGPYIHTFSPWSGGGGTTVTLKGANFSGVSGVTFNGVAGTYVTPTTYDELVVTAPTGVSTGPIKVTTSKGSWTTTSNFWVAPTITSFFPWNGRATTNVIIKGKSFLGVTNLTFNGTPAESFIINSSTQITAVIAAPTTTGLIMASNTGGRTFSSSNFVILPTIANFQPVGGPVGTVVTINGANLNVGGTPTVKFNGIQATVVAGSLSATQLRVTVPANAKTGPITLQTTDGLATSAELFYLPPTVSYFNPGVGGGDIKVIVDGENFLGATNVWFNETSAGVPVVSNNTRLTITTPTNGTTGRIRVEGPGGNGSSAVDFIYPPIISSFAPSCALTGQIVNIYGINLTYCTNVAFGAGNTANFTIQNATNVSASVPTNASTGPLMVMTLGGVATADQPFVLDQVIISMKRLTNNLLKLSWTTNAVGYTLQYATNFWPTNWIVQSNPLPVWVDGKLTVTNPLTSTNTFYRLKK